MRFTVPLVLSLLFWGSAFPGIRAGLKGYDPAMMAVLRFVTASVTLIPMALVKGFKPPRRQDWPLFLAASFFSIPGYHLCLNIGEKNVTASSASLILSTLPVWTILLTGFFIGEKFPKRAWFGVGLSFFGAAVIALGEGSGFHFNPYVWLVLASSVCGSIYTTIQKKLIVNYDSLSFNCVIIWVGTIYMLPLSKGLFGAVAAAPLDATLAVIYLGIVPGAITFVLWANVIKQIPASRAVTYLYLLPVVATLIGWFWLGEFPPMMSIIGGAVILSGVALTRFLSR